MMANLSTPQAQSAVAVRGECVLASRSEKLAARRCPALRALEHVAENGRVVRRREPHEGDEAARVRNRLLDSLKGAKDPWATSREEKPIKQFIPIRLEA
jgi:hypothetical protein